MEFPDDAGDVFVEFEVFLDVHSKQLGLHFLFQRFLTDCKIDIIIFDGVESVGCSRVVSGAV